MNTKSTVEVITEWDIVAARQLGRNEAKAIGFGAVDQARITTAISELARNIYLYARAGEVTIERVYKDGKVGIRITATDKGPGIDNLKKLWRMGSRLLADLVQVYQVSRDLWITWISNPQLDKGQLLSLKNGFSRKWEN